MHDTEALDAGDAVLRIGADDRIADCNHAAQRAFGRTRAQCLGQHVQALGLAVDDLARWHAALQRARGGGAARLELTLDSADGPRRWQWTLQGDQIAPAAPGTVLAIGRAPDPPAPADHAAVQRSALLEAIVESLPEALFAKDRDGRYIVCNAAAAQLMGGSAQRLLGQLDTPLVDAKLAARWRASDLQVMADGQVRQEPPEMLPNGREIETTLAPLHVDGQLRGVFGVSRDITERQRNERRMLELTAELEQRVRDRTAELDRSLAQLRHVNQELETFTYSVSHDLKAPLRGIDGYSRLLQSDYAQGLDDEGREFIARIRQATQHMGQLIDDLLTYSRLERRDLHLNAVPLDPLVEAVLAACSDQIAAQGAEIKVSLAPGLVGLGDPQGLTMALRNLLDNALKFSAHSQPPRIRVFGERGDGVVRITVVDNGVGFDMRFHDRIFAIFQRLHRAEDYPGTGVGLAIVRKAMERMHGRVWAASQPGHGASFSVEFPEAI